MTAEGMRNVRLRPTWSVFFPRLVVVATLAAFCPGVRADVRSLSLDNVSGQAPIVIYWPGSPGVTNLLLFPLGHTDVSVDMPEVVTLSTTNIGFGPPPVSLDLGGLSGCELVVGVDNSGALNVLRIGSTKSEYDWFLYGVVFGGVWFVFALAVRIVKQVGHQSPEL